MRIRKDYFQLGLIALGLFVIAIAGFNIWNNQILGTLGKLNEYSLYLILGFSFIAGMISFFSPCGLALLPAFISYNMLMVNENPNPHKRELKTKILKIGIFSALGISSFYVVLGIVFSLVGRAIAPYLQIFQFIIAFLFVLFGAMLIKKFALTFRLFEKLRRYITSEAIRQSGYKGFYLFGFAYGLDIIGCLFPLILALVLIPIATGDLVTGISAFVSYSIALAVMISIFAYFVAYSKNKVIAKITRSTEKIHRWAGIGLMIGGILLIVYYLSPFAMGI